MAVDIKVVRGPHVVHIRAMGVWRDQESNKLLMLHNSFHSEFEVGNDVDDDYTEVHPREHVLWVS